MLPNKIRILGRKYVVKVEDLPPSVLGETDRTDHKIRLSPKLSPQIALETLLHELCHVAFLETGLDNMIAPKQKEAICDCIALAFSDILVFKKESKKCLSQAS
jgi:hypothetical protein